MIGRFAIDFVAVRDTNGAWTSYAIELNLRKGGTTHPFLTLQFLTDGRYDARSGLFLTADGREKHLVATDHLESDEPAGAHASTTSSTSSPATDLHFDQARQSGSRVSHDQLSHGDTDVSGSPRSGTPPPKRRRCTSERSGPCWTRREPPSSNLLFTRD